MPEAVRRQREREIKLELLKDADMYDHFFFFLLFFFYFISCISTLNYVGNSSPYAITGKDQTRSRREQGLELVN